MLRDSEVSTAFGQQLSVKCDRITPLRALSQ
jgi:hypothetical protein